MHVFGVVFPFNGAHSLEVYEPYLYKTFLGFKIFLSSKTSYSCPELLTLRAGEPRTGHDELRVVGQTWVR